MSPSKESLLWVREIQVLGGWNIFNMEKISPSNFSNDKSLRNIIFAWAEEDSWIETGEKVLIIQEGDNSYIIAYGNQFNSLRYEMDEAWFEVVRYSGEELLSLVASWKEQQKDYLKHEVAKFLEEWLDHRNDIVYPDEEANDSRYLVSKGFGGAKPNLIT